MVGMKNHAAAAVLAARRSPRLRGRADEGDEGDEGDQVLSALFQRGQRPVVAAANGEVATHHVALGRGDHRWRAGDGASENGTAR
jgi:hypothetical protein